MKSLYQGFRILALRLKDGQIRYAILNLKTGEGVMDNTISGDSSVRQMVHNCKLLIDDTLLHPLHEFYSEFIQ
jgi:hypothetical protein